METIAKFQDTDIVVIKDPTREVFIPLLKANLPQIKKTAKKTFKYGSTERHQLDIYYPSERRPNTPILFWYYGGAFVSGARNLVPGVVFDNVGSFFAQLGILTIVPDYRLAPSVTYPEPVKDLRDALKFVLSSSEVDITGHGGDPNNIYFAGHSAGACHIMTLLFNDSIWGDFDRSCFKGAILVSGVYSVVPPRARPYYGPEDDYTSKTPLGLLRSHSFEKAKELAPPKVFILVAENDPPDFFTTAEELKKEFKERKIQYHSSVMKGHNHISIEGCLSSGEGEDWGEEVAKWIKA